MGMPKPGTTEYEKMVEFMRYDLENNMAGTRLIEAARKVVEASGRNFDEEYTKYRNQRRGKVK